MNPYVAIFRAVAMTWLQQAIKNSTSQANLFHKEPDLSREYLRSTMVGIVEGNAKFADPIMAAMMYPGESDKMRMEESRAKAIHQAKFEIDLILDWFYSHQDRY